LGVTAELEFAELHVKRVEKEQAVEQRGAFTEDEFQDLGGLNGADYAGQHAQHAALGAARDGARWRGLGIKAAVARSSQMRREHAGLPVESEDGAVNVWLAEQHASVVREVAGGKVVRAIYHDVIGADDLQGVLARKASVVKDDLDPRIEAVDGFLR
jgi:hypothetical protein